MELDTSAGDLVTEPLVVTIGNLLNATEGDTIDFHVGVYGTASDTHSSGPGSLGFGISDTVFGRKIIHYCFGTLLVLIGIAGAVGNGLVLYVFTRYQRLRGGGGRLILSLACGDFMVSVLHFMPAYSSFKEVWSFGDVGCQLYAASVGLGGLASLISLAAIAMDRFSVIIGNPLPWLSGKKSCLSIWFFSACLISPPFLGWSRYVPEGLETSCSWDYTTRTFNNRSYYIFLLSFGFLVPVLAIIVSYFGILGVVYKHSHKMNGVTRNGVIHNKRKPTKSDLRTTQVILTIIVFFVASWTPYAIVSFIGQFGPVSSDLSPLSSALPAVFAKASVIYNPIIYGLSHPHFRSAIRMLKLRHFSSARRQEGTYGCNNNRSNNAPGSHGNRAPLLAGHAKHHDGRQKMKSRADMFPRPFNSINLQTSDAGTTLRTDWSSDNKEIIVNNKKKGCGVLRRFSRPESDLTAGAACTEEVSSSCTLDSTSYSEPDLLHKKDFGVTKAPECIRLSEYRRQKHTFLRKTFFRSEILLENLLKSKVRTSIVNVSSKPTFDSEDKSSKIVSGQSGSGTKCVGNSLNAKINPKLAAAPMNNKYNSDEEKEEDEDWAFHKEVCVADLDHSFSCHNFTDHLDSRSVAGAGVVTSSTLSSAVHRPGTGSNGMNTAARHTGTGEAPQNNTRFTLWKNKSFSTSFSSNDYTRVHLERFWVGPSGEGAAPVRLRRVPCVRKRRKSKVQFIPIQIPAIHSYPPDSYSHQTNSNDNNIFCESVDGDMIALTPRHPSPSSSSYSSSSSQQDSSDDSSSIKDLDTLQHTAKIPPTKSSPDDPPSSNHNVYGREKTHFIIVQSLKGNNEGTDERRGRAPQSKFEKGSGDTPAPATPSSSPYKDTFYICHEAGSRDATINSCTSTNPNANPNKPTEKNMKKSMRDRRQFKFHPQLKSIDSIRNRNSSLDSACLTSCSDDAEFTDREVYDVERNGRDGGKVHFTNSRFQGNIIGTRDISKNTGRTQGFSRSFYETQT